MNIIHDFQQHKFYYQVDNLEAHLQYRYVDDRTLSYYHTYVPPTLRNQGIAQALVADASRYALEHHFKVIPSCSYVALYLKRHPEYAEIVENT